MREVWKAYESRIDSEFAWILIQPLTCGISSNKRPVIHLGNGERLHDSLSFSCICGNSRRLAVVLTEKRQLSQSRQGGKVAKKEGG